MQNKQYIGETKRTLRELPSHFNQRGHSIEDMELIPLELQATLSMSRHKVRKLSVPHR